MGISVRFPRHFKLLLWSDPNYVHSYSQFLHTLAQSKELLESLLLCLVIFPSFATPVY
jgi:hypothetical protein